MALVTARVFTRRPKIMVFKGGYHGGVLLFKTGGAPQNAPFPIVLGIYNDADATVSIIDREADELAAVIVEPMQGSGGCIPADPAFLRSLREACTRRGILLVFDEVMTSRLAPGGLQEALGVLPDLTTLGKYVGGGLPFGAFGGREDIMLLYDPFRPDALAHAGTFNNNALTMAAGVAAMTSVYTPERARALNESGETLRIRLATIASSRGAPLQFTGRGSMMNAHFKVGPIRTSEDADQGSAEARTLFHLGMLERGQYLARRGMINLSLPMGPDEHDALVQALENFLDVYAADLAGIAEPRRAR